MSLKRNWQIYFIDWTVNNLLFPFKKTLQIFRIFFQDILLWFYFILFIATYMSTFFTLNLKRGF